MNHNLTTTTDFSDKIKHRSSSKTQRSEDPKIAARCSPSPLDSIDITLSKPHRFTLNLHLHADIHNEDPSIALVSSAVAASSSKAAKPKSAKKAKTQAPAGGPNPSPGPPVPAPPTLGTSSPTKLCLSGITCTDTLTCVSSGYSECNPSGCCVNAENPPGPPVSFSPVTSPPTSELSLFTALGAGLCNDNQGRLYPLIVGNLGSFQGSASDAENCAQWCNQYTTNLVGMDYFSNAGVLECHCLFSGSVPSPTPIYKDPPSSGMRPNSGAGAVAKATSDPSAPTAQCYALLSAGTTDAP